MCKRTGKFVILRQTCGPARAVPVDCGDIFCVECEKMRAARRAAGWLPVIKKMRSSVMLTPTIKDGGDLRDRIQVYQASFRRFLDTRLGARNRPKFLALAGEFVIEHYSKLLIEGNLTSAEYAEKVTDWDRSLDLFDKRLGRIGKTLRLRDVIGRGIALFECTWDKDWHPHRHLILDTKFLPWPYLVILWRSATRGQGQVIDIRPIGKSDKDLKEVFKYLSKTWEIPENRRDEFRDAVRSLKRVWPLGGSKPVKVDKECPFCGSSTCHPRIVGMGEDCQVMRVGDQEIMQVQIGEGTKAIDLYFVNIKGTWTEAKPEAVDLILREIACHSAGAPPTEAIQKVLI